MSIKLFPTGKHRLLLGIGGGALIFIALLIACGAYAYLSFNPELGRKLKVIPTLYTQTEEARQMRGYVFRNFETQTFVPCEEYKDSVFGPDAYALVSSDTRFEDELQKLADAQGSKITMGVFAYARFTGQRSWLHNAQPFEDNSSSGMNKKRVTILELQELLPMDRQCLLP
jgi:hypothetical protein